jgi:hypothetical protein
MTPQKLAWEQKWRNLFGEVERRVDYWLERWGEIGMKSQKERRGEDEIVWTISWKETEPTQTRLTLCLELGKEDGRRRIALQRNPFNQVTIERLHREENMKTKWAKIDRYLERLLVNLLLHAAKEELSSKLGYHADVSSWREEPTLAVWIGGWIFSMSFQLCDDGTFKWVLPGLDDSDEWHIVGSKGDDPMALLAEAVKALPLSLL